MITRTLNDKTASAQNAPASGPFTRHLLLRKDGKIFSADTVEFKSRSDYDGYLSDFAERGISVSEISEEDVNRIKGLFERGTLVTIIDGEPVFTGVVTQNDSENDEEEK